MIQAKITKNFDLRKIKLDIHRELNQGIDIIADNISEGIDRGGQFGKRFAPEREDISFWHNTGAKPNPQREHWGISTRADDKIDKIIDKAVRKNIDRTRRARIA
jgi:hypothetical protein